MKKKLMIYPLSAETMPLVRHLGMTEYHLYEAVSPKAWGYCGRDVGFLDGGSIMGISVGSDYKKALELVDALLICELSNLIDQRIYKKIIERTIALNKTIFLPYESEYDLWPNCQSNINYYGSNVIQASNAVEQKMKIINIPTLLVIGAGENCDKFDLQLSLREYFSGRGCSILQFGTRSFSSFFGFSPLPDFLFESIDYKEKILRFNSFLFEEVKTHHADLLIIGVPGGIERSALKEPRGFGELAHVISNSVDADLCIMSLYYDLYPDTFLEKVRAKLFYSFGIPHTFFHVSNKKFLFDEDRLSNLIDYLTISKSPILTDEKLFNIHDEESRSFVYKNIYDLISETRLTLE